jgi:hypothetical protein
VQLQSYPLDLLKAVILTRSRENLLDLILVSTKKMIELRPRNSIFDHIKSRKVN